MSQGDSRGPPTATAKYIRTPSTSLFHITFLRKIGGNGGVERKKNRVGEGEMVWLFGISLCFERGSRYDAHTILKQWTLCLRIQGTRTTQMNLPSTTLRNHSLPRNILRNWTYKKWTYMKHLPETLRSPTLDVICYQGNYGVSLWVFHFVNINGLSGKLQDIFISVWEKTTGKASCKSQELLDEGIRPWER